jgi:hypothetical protein
MQPRHPVLHRVERGEHEDRRPDAPDAQLPADLAPVPARQEEVEDDDGDVLRRAHVEALRPRPRHIDRMALRPQPAGDEIDDPLVVLDQEDVHALA